MTDTYQVTDRRPIAARQLPIMDRAAARLARAGVSANAISVAGMLAAIAAGGALVCTSLVSPNWSRLLWIAAAALVQLRLLANLLDGMVAIATGTASPIGELFNDVPDRISDVAVLVGLGYAAGSHAAMGWCAAVAAVWTAYARVLGKASGTPSDFRGPMAKQQRMFTVTMVSLVAAVIPGTSATLQLPCFALSLIVAGCMVTFARRLFGIAAVLKGRA